MIVTDVVSHHLSYPVIQPYRNCCSEWIRSRPATLTEVRTDKGLVGWGEGDGSPSRADIETHVLGRSPLDVGEIYDAMVGVGNPAPVACGLEMALWDLMGKSLDKPVYELLGGPLRDRITAYASGFFELQGVDHLKCVAAEARRCRDAGFKAAKMRIGYGGDQDERIVATVRDAMGDAAQLAGDVNLGYDLSTAIAVGRRLAAYDLLWYEEPIAADDLDGYVALRQEVPMAIAGAESRSGLRAFRQVVERGALDIIQPDISRAGGFTEGQRICALASEKGVRVIPHMFGTAVRLAATLQWLATIPEDQGPCYLELDVTENGLRCDLSPTPFPLEDGQIAIPDRPGLGVEIDREALRKYAVT